MTANTDLGYLPKIKYVVAIHFDDNEPPYLEFDVENSLPIIPKINEVITTDEGDAFTVQEIHHRYIKSNNDHLKHLITIFAEKAIVG
ncbi:MAG TPA: hypothetical protein VFO76_08280 [Candidatus Kapabacteria bacterium]|nr:hypothetical protein [Candidatus Kapabacteria bacterium]